MANKCEDCARLKKRHRIINGREYFRMCLESEEYMDIENTKVLHNCNKFFSRKKAEKERQEQINLKGWRKKMKDRWKK